MKEYIVLLDEEEAFYGYKDNAQELIRCRDCKYAKKIYIKNLPWLKQWEYSCAYFNTHSVNGDEFCSNAEPKDKP